MPQPETSHIHRVLVAVDTSPRAPGVLSAARELAGRFGARLHVYQAVYIPPDIPAAAHTGGSGTDRELERLAERKLAALVGDAPGTVIEPLEFGVGQPWRAILAAAERIQADLIVVGSHGYGGMDHVIGTTSAKVVNHASCSVFVVHERLRDGL